MNVQKKATDKPPIGYSNWQEAAQDADENGVLAIWDARDREAFIVVPEEFTRTRTPKAKHDLRVVHHKETDR